VRKIKVEYWNCWKCLLIQLVLFNSVLHILKKVTWKEVMKMRDIIAHHYFKIDAEVIFMAIREDLVPLTEALLQIKADLNN